MYNHPHLLQVGGAAEALIEQYNDQLREIRERGLADTEAAEPLRELLRALRDQPRITEGSVKVCGALLVVQQVAIFKVELLSLEVSEVRRLVSVTSLHVAEPSCQD